MKVLIIEDSDAINNWIAFVARRISKKIHCDCALTAEDALSFLEHNKYDFIICDIDIPRISGPKILLQSELHGAKILFISSLSEYQDRIEPCLAAGLNVLAFQKKPFLPEQLEDFLNA